MKEALERKSITIKQGKTRIESKCIKCGALNRVSAGQGQVRVPYTLRNVAKNKGHSEKTSRGLSSRNIFFHTHVAAAFSKINVEA